ncbi:MAG: hypothetical protein AAF926_03885, partial [Pseudomonadota bacterium]
MEDAVFRIFAAIALWQKWARDGDAQKPAAPYRKLHSAVGYRQVLFVCEMPEALSIPVRLIRSYLSLADQ